MLLWGGGGLNTLLSAAVGYLLIAKIFMGFLRLEVARYCKIPIRLECNHGECHGSDLAKHLRI